MKQLLISILILLSCIKGMAQNFYTPVTMGSYPARINSFTVLGSVFITNQTRSDTVRITGTTNGWYLGTVNGADSLHPFVIYVQGKQDINGGIGIENCKYVKIIAPDSVRLLSGGVPFVIKAHADYIQITGLIILNGLNGAAWIKEDAPQACDYPDPLNYLYPNHQRYIWFTDFRIGNADGTGASGGEGLYIGSTGSYGRDAVPCLGNQIYKPMFERDIHILRGNIYNTGRTGWQISGADSGYNEIKYVNVYNPGRELNPSQGAGGRTGYGTNNTTEIAFCKAKNTYIYNFDLETGCNFHDNTGDSAGYWYQTKNSQQIPSIICYASLPNSTLQLCSNKAGYNSAQPSTNFAIYGSSNYTNNNIVGNNTGNVVVLAQPFNYTTNCGSQPTITTNSISGSPFCVTASASAAVSVNWTSSGTYNSGNIYTAQLSNVSGSFVSPVNIGTQSSTGNSGTISATIPANTTTGTGYRIRVVSNNPSVTGSDNGTNLSINLAANSIAPTATQNIYTSTNGSTLTVTEQSTATSRLWYVNGTSSGISTTTYTPNFATAGTYVVDCRSVFTCGTITSNSVTVNVTVAPPPPPDSIFTGTISGSPFCVTTSAGAAVTVPFTSNRGSFNSGNIFTAQLSNSAGSFASAINIGTLSSTSASGSISATIPANTTTGTGYKIRVISTNPAVTGIVSASTLTINLASNSITPAATQNILTNINGNTLTVTETSTASSRLWYVDGVSSGVTTTTYTPNFSSAGTYNITASSVFACGTITSNSVAIVVTAPPPPPVDTGCTNTTVKTTHDTLVLGHFPATYKDSLYTITKLIKIDTVKHRNRTFTVRLTFNAPKDTIVKVLARSAYDSAYYVTNGAYHDTVICVPNVNRTTYGGFIINGYNSLSSLASRLNYNKRTLNVPAYRYNYDFGATYSNKQVLDSGQLSLMTGSHNNAANPRTFPMLTSQLTKTWDSLFTISSPTLLSWLNEPATFAYWDTTGLTGTQGANNYLSTFNALCTVAHNHQVFFCDGGFTYSVIYSLADYYNRIGRSDSITYLQGKTGIANFSNTAAKIYLRDFYNTLINGVKASQADYVQLHWYEPIGSDTSVTTTSGLLTVVANYLVQQTGKPIITLETGTYNYNQNLFNGMMTEWKKANAKYITYYLNNYLGYGYPTANPNYYINFTVNNP